MTLILAKLMRWPVLALAGLDGVLDSVEGKDTVNQQSADGRRIFYGSQAHGLAEGAVEGCQVVQAVLCDGPARRERCFGRLDFCAYLTPDLF